MKNKDIKEFGDQNKIKYDDCEIYNFTKEIPHFEVLSVHTQNTNINNYL